MFETGECLEKVKKSNFSDIHLVNKVLLVDQDISRSKFIKRISLAVLSWSDMIWEYLPKGLSVLSGLAKYSSDESFILFAFKEDFC